MPPPGVSFSVRIGRIGQLPIEQLGFAEPENPNRVNLVENGFEGGLFVFSDRPASPPFINPTVFQQFSDGNTVGGVGFDQSNGMGTALTFHDNAASSEPDKGSTFSLLAFGLIGLFFARRRAAGRAG